MKVERLAEMLKSLTRCATPMGMARPTDEPYAAYGIVSFVGSEALDSLRDTLDRVSSDPVYRGFSRGLLRSKLLSAVEDLLRSQPKLTPEQHARRIDEDLSAEDECDWTIARPLLGGHLVGKDTLDLGMIRIVRSESLLREVAASDECLRETEPDAIWDTRPEWVVVTSVRAREDARAIELADDVFGNAENLLRYFAGSLSDHHSVGILNHRRLDSLHCFAYSYPGRTTVGAAKTGAVLLTNLGELPSPAGPDARGKLWDLLGLNGLTGLQRRMLAAVNWIGRGLNDARSANSFVQFMFAVEALLTFQDKGVIVTPSIASQISEACAFILAESPESRKRTEREVKDLYRIRSSIAHGSDESVRRVDVLRALMLARALVDGLVGRPELAILSRVEDLYRWVQEQRYAS